MPINFGKICVLVEIVGRVLVKWYIPDPQKAHPIPQTQFSHVENSA